MLITSTSNPAIKEIRKLRERKERERTGLYVLEGLRLVGEAVQQNAVLDRLVVAGDFLASEFGWSLVEECRARGVRIMEVGGEVFQSLAMKERPQGLLAVGRQRWDDLPKIAHSLDIEEHIWVALDEVADPGNLGTILRTLDAVGGEGIILLDHSTDPYDPSALRGSMGAIFSQQIIRASFEEFSAWKQSSGIQVVGATGAASQDYHACAYPNPVILLMGSERQGLQTRHIDLCDALVSIPMVGRSDSLNLAVASAVVLYEIFNQRRDGRRK